MGIFTGLKDIERAIGPKRGSTFLKVKDGDAFRIRFLQELDQSSPEYNEQNGLGILVLEHSHPKNFRIRAVCTQEEEGRCWACEQRVVDNKWRPRGKLYINVVVQDEDATSSDDGWNDVRVLNQGLGPRNVAQTLIEAANEYGSITNHVFKLKRTGSGMSDTAYTLTLLPTADELDDVTGYNLHDLEALVKKVPYDKQETFYQGSGDNSDGDGW